VARAHDLRPLPKVRTQKHHLHGRTERRTSSTATSKTTIRHHHHEQNKYKKAPNELPIVTIDSVHLPPPTGKDEQINIDLRRVQLRRPLRPRLGRRTTVRKRVDRSLVFHLLRHLIVHHHHIRTQSGREVTTITLFSHDQFNNIIPSCRFKYPDRPIVYLSACYALVSLGYIVTFFHGQRLACDYQQQSTIPSKTTTHFTMTSSSPPLIVRYSSPTHIDYDTCTLVAVLIYYFGMAAAIWQVTLLLYHSFSQVN
jgi:hypothetical protein